MEDLKKMKLVGYYSFKAKEKDFNYYVIQVLNYVLSQGSNKAVLTNIFVSENDFSRLVNDFGIGSEINVSCNINIETNKVYYKIVL